jgi:CheY-like chemotaxis protein
MAATVANRAFEPFYTTRTQIKAPGLGLTIVHSVATIHGGQVELQSAEEKGTTVTVWIPVNGFVNRETPGLRSGVRPAWGERKKVLLIEDDPLVKEVVRDWLGRIGFDVQVAADGQEAESFFIRKPSDLSLVISEVDLKSGRGEEIYARIRKGEGTWSVPWIFLAGRRRPEVPEGLDGGGPSPMVMQKPVTLRALAELVRRHATA